MQLSGIYKITNINTGKIYIGSTVNFVKRWKHHQYELNLNKHHSQKLQHSWNKHGSEAFLFEMILHCKREDLSFYEQYFIDALNPIKQGYNISPNACNNLGLKKTPEQIEKHRLRMIGTKQTEEHKNKISQSMKGKTNCLGNILSEEHKAKISQSMKGKTNSLGSVLSEEHKAKISAANKGKIQSDETRLKRSLTQKGIPKSEETKLRMTVAARNRTNRPRGPYKKKPKSEE